MLLRCLLHESQLCHKRCNEFCRYTIDGMNYREEGATPGVRLVMTVFHVGECVC